MCLIVGLGNPGKNYERTRHNVGFLVVEEIVHLVNEPFKPKKDLLSFIAQTKINNRATEIIKPTTFMNLSGEAVFKAAKFWRVPLKKITVIFDEVNLPLGKIRVRESGSAGGHNGMKSIIEKMKSENLRRIRIGVGRPENTNIPLDQWVLGKWDKEEWKKIVETAREVAKKIVTGEIPIS